MPGTVLGTGNSAVKTQTKLSILLMLVEEKGYQQN